MVNGFDVVKVKRVGEWVYLQVSQVCTFVIQVAFEVLNVNVEIQTCLLNDGHVRGDNFDGLPVVVINESAYLVRSQ